MIDWPFPIVPAASPVNGNVVVALVGAVSFLTMSAASFVSV